MSTAKKDFAISFKDLCLYIILRWRSIIACTLIAALLLCGAKFALDLKDSGETVVVSSVDALSKNMSDEQIATAKGAVACKQLFDKHSLYMASSNLMEIPYASVPTSTLTFNISGPDALFAANSLAGHIGSDDLISKLDFAKDDIYIAERFSSKISSDNSLNNSDTVLTVFIYGRDKDSAVALASEVEKFLNQKAVEIATDTDCEISDAQNAFSVNYQENVRVIQQNAVNIYNNLRGALKEALTLLDSAELAYYNTAIADESAEQTVETKPAEKKTPDISIKFLILGAAVGFVISAFIHFAAYLFAKKVKSAEDMRTRCSINLLGDVSYQEKKICFVDKFILKIFGAAEYDSIEFAVSKISAAISAANANSLLIISDEKTATDSLIEKLKEPLSKLGCKYNFELSPINSAEELEKLNDADCVMLLKSVNNSAYGDINRELELCELYGKTVIGATVIR